MVGTSTVTSAVNVLALLRSANRALFLYCVTPSASTINGISILSPATADVALTLIRIDPTFSGEIRNDTGVPSFEFTVILVERDASIAVKENRSDFDVLDVLAISNSHVSDILFSYMLPSLDQQIRIVSTNYLA